LRSSTRSSRSRHTFTEDAAGYEKLFDLVGASAETLVHRNRGAARARSSSHSAHTRLRRSHEIHRVVDLGSPEFTRFVKSLDSELATAILHDYPTAEALHGISMKRLAGLRDDGRHKVGPELAAELVAAAKASVGRHHGDAYRVQVRFFCEDLDTLRKRILQIERDVETKLGEHEVGTLLTTIDGIGRQTAARLAEFDDPSTSFRNGSAFTRSWARFQA
jgi:transposase